MKKEQIAKALLKRVFQLQDNGHYASAEFSNYGQNIRLSAIRGGFRVNNGYDFCEYFDFYESEKVLNVLLRLDDIIEEWGVKEESEVTENDAVSD